MWWIEFCVYCEASFKWKASSDVVLNVWRKIPMAMHCTIILQRALQISLSCRSSDVILESQREAGQDRAALETGPLLVSGRGQRGPGAEAGHRP